jgi:hypothetical protein
MTFLIWLLLFSDYYLRLPQKEYQYYFNIKEHYNTKAEIFSVKSTLRKVEISFFHSWTTKVLRNKGRKILSFILLSQKS